MLTNFRQNLEEGDVPTPWDAPANSSQESETAAPKEVGVGKLNIANKNYEGACRQRTGHAIPRAEKFGDMITTDHKVLSEGCESRHSHRHAVVVQDLSSRWMDFKHIRED